MKRFMVWAIALVFLFCTSAIAGEPKKDAAPAPEKKEMKAEKKEMKDEKKAPKKKAKKAVKKVKKEKKEMKDEKKADAPAAK